MSFNVFEFNDRLHNVYLTLQLLYEKKIISVSSCDVEECAASLKPVIVDTGLTPNDSLYYLVLSVDHGHYENLVDDSHVGFVMLNSVSGLKLEWFVEILREMDYITKLAPIVRFGSVGITIPILEAIFTRIGITHCSSLCLLNSLAFKTCQLVEKEDYHAGGFAWTCLHKWLSKLFKEENRLLQENPSDAALVLQEVLNIVCIIVDSPSCTLTIELSHYYELDHEYVPEFESRLGHIGDIRSHLQNCILAMLSDCLQGITCNVWLDWEEILDNETSMQSNIGYLFFKLDELLVKNCINVKPELKTCLSQLAIKPFSELEMIKTAKLDDILSAIEYGQSNFLSDWYTELIHREITWTNHDCVRIVLLHIELNKSENHQTIFTRILDYLYSSSDLTLKDEFLAALQNKTEIKDQLQVLLEIGNRGFGLFATEFPCEIGTQVIFNRVSSESAADEFLKDMIPNLIQQPGEVIIQLFKLTMQSRSNHQLVKDILTKLKFLMNCRDFRPTENEELIIVVMKEILSGKYSYKEEDRFVDFLELIEDLKLNSFSMENSILCVLDAAISENDWKSIKFLLRIVKIVLLNDKMNEVLLVYLLQLIWLTSWDAFSYEPSKTDANKTCLEVLRHFSFEGMNVPGWLMNMLTQLPPIIRSHFGRYLSCNEEDLHVKLLFQIRDQPSTTNEVDNWEFTDQGTLFNAIVKVIPLLHSDEWARLFHVIATLLSDSQLAFQMISLSVSLLAEHCSSDVLPCTKYCINNLTLIFDHLQGTLPSLFLLKYLLKPLKGLPLEVREDCYYTMVPVIVKLLKSPALVDLEQIDNYLRMFDVAWRVKILDLLKSNKS